MRRLSYTSTRSIGLESRRLPQLMIVLVVCSSILALPAYAAAEAVVGPESTPGPSGLPDGRVYEQASPANKHGNEPLNYERPAMVAPNGQAVMYGTSGALGGGASSNSAITPTVVSERTAHGWTTRSALPLPAEGKGSVEENVGIGTLQTLTVPSADLSRLLFATWNFVPYVGAPDEPKLPGNVYLAGSDPFAEPEWVGRSMFENGYEGGPTPVGTSPDLKTIYFYWRGGLLPAGASRLYEYKDGTLNEIGTLPNGETSDSSATPAAQPELGQGEVNRSLTSAAGYDNQVSADGSRIFFVRQDEAGTWELYVYLNTPDSSHRTVLISQSQLPGHVGEPAPDGPQQAPSTEREGDTYYGEYGGARSQPSYVFASPDGSHAFFQSADRLTEAAPEDSTAKTYDFDLETSTLEYLPGVTGPIVTAADDGSSVIFENTATSPFQLERWVVGPGGGTVKPIVQLPPATRNVCDPAVCVGPAYTSSNGKVVIFATDSPIAGFKDGGSHYALAFEVHKEEPLVESGLYPNYEIFRYDAENNQLRCLSCTPQGMTPTSNAIMSKDDFLFNSLTASGAAEILTPGRATSPDDGRAFFETRDALVPQDTNGTVDVYEWDNGTVYLISSGNSPQPSYFTGLSESSDDAFFMTAEGIAPGDGDGSFDVYDARVRRPGDNPPPEAVPCEGAVCQGPPSTPQLLGQPASEAFNGAGNVTPLPPSHSSAPKSLTRGQRLARALRVCKRREGARKRRKCEQQARRRYGATSARAQRVSRQSHHRNGRGK